MKLEYDKLLSRFALRFNLRRYTLDPNVTQYNFSIVTLNATSVDGELRLVAGAYTRPLFGST